MKKYAPSVKAAIVMNIHDKSNLNINSTIMTPWAVVELNNYTNIVNIGYDSKK